MTTAAEHWKARVMETCDVPRAAEIAVEMVAGVRDNRAATTGDAMFALAMATAVMVAALPTDQRVAAVGAMVLMIEECIPLAVERMNGAGWLHRPRTAQ